VFELLEEFLVAELANQIVVCGRGQRQHNLTAAYPENRKRHYSLGKRAKVQIRGAKQA